MSLIDDILNLFSRSQTTNNGTNTKSVLDSAPSLSDIPPILLSNGTDAGKVIADSLANSSSSGLATSGQIPTNTVPPVSKAAVDTGLAQAQIDPKLMSQYQNTYGVEDPQVLQSILQASHLTGADPDVMLKIAKAESEFNPNAKNKRSSASGLYQFINSTWKGMGSAAKDTYSGFKGNVLDPMDNAIAGGLYINQMKDALAPVKKSGDVTVRDIYLAHFSGPSKAKQVIKALDDGKGNQLASNFYSKEQMYANKDVFFSKGGKTRTLQEVYDLLTNKVA